MDNTFRLSWLRLDESMFLHEVDAFRDYILKSIESIKDVQTEFEKDWKNDIVRDLDEEDEFIFRYEEEIEINKTFKLIPHIAFSSLYISISSLFESSIKNACKSTSHLPLALKWRDMAGNSDFEKVRSFLSKVALVDLNPINEPWAKVMSYYKLRNRIVHHGSKVDVDNNKKIIDKDLQGLFTKYNSSLSLQGEEDFLVTDSQILLEYLEAIKEIITGLYKILQERLMLIKP
ncbi:MAG TPA: hypothetical protein VNX01_04915 [Bacteroidia bacterium]|jgi:hypothetical protein|nr:hypothetical protein [Bacteroidia bacterium]